MSLLPVLLFWQCHPVESHVKTTGSRRDRTSVGGKYHQQRSRGITCNDTLWVKRNSFKFYFIELKQSTENFQQIRILKLGYCLNFDKNDMGLYKSELD